MKKLLLALTLLASFSALSLVSAPKTAALSGSDFNAGKIMDDGVFFNPAGIDIGQIQQFLNAKVPTCDTWGAQPYGGTTRSAYGTSRGNPPPFICLKDYRQETPTRSADGLCNQYFGGNKSAAQIIHDVGHACGVNPKVLLVILEKEQSLVTDDWPWTVQYNSATGFGCPDTAPCDPQFGAFFDQVYYAARQFKRYARDASLFRYKPYRENYIQFHPNTSCGGTNVYVHNQATAGLYNYTPYQPNATALSNLYGGQTDGCSSYGNRNFWRLFNDWFGSTNAYNGNIILSQSLAANVSGTVYQGQTVTASYRVSNIANYDTLAGGLGICGRIDGQYYDFGFTNQTNIPANGTVTISYSKTLDRSGNLQLFICSYHASIGGWASPTYPYNSSTAQGRTLSMTVAANPLITSGVTFSPANPAIGQAITASMTVRNNSASPVNVGAIGVAARDKNGYNADFPYTTDVTIPANSDYTYSGQRTMVTQGNYSFFVANFRNTVWATNYPQAASGAARSGNFFVQDSPLITSGVTFSPANPAIGQAITASMVIQNTNPYPVNIGAISVAARDKNGYNADFPYDTSVVIPANSSYTYSKQRTMITPGPYSFFIANFRNNAWDRNYPSSGSGVVRSGNFSVQDSPLITSGVTFSPANPVIGQTITASMAIQNTNPYPVNIGTIVVAARDKNGYNADFTYATDVTISANSTYTYSGQRAMVTPGPYSFFVANYRNNAWSTSYPQASSGVIRSGGFSVGQ